MFLHQVVKYQRYLVKVTKRRVSKGNQIIDNSENINISGVCTALEYHGVAPI